MSEVKVLALSYHDLRAHCRKGLNQTDHSHASCKSNKFDMDSPLASSESEICVTFPLDNCKENKVYPG